MVCAQNAPETGGDAPHTVAGSSMLVSDCVSAWQGMGSDRAIAEAPPQGVCIVLVCSCCMRMQTHGNARGYVGGSREGDWPAFCRRTIFSLCCSGQLRGVRRSVSMADKSLMSDALRRVQVGRKGYGIDQ